MVPATELKSIVIKAPHLNLTVRQNSSPNHSIKWMGALSVQVKKGVLTIQSPDFNSKKSWTSPSSKKSLTLNISGPSRPLQLFSFSSQSSFTGWTKSIFISSFKGGVKAHKNKGPIEISLKEGAVNIRRQTGDLTVHGFLVHLSLDSSEGDFRFYINEGFLKIKKSKGAVHFTTDKAETRLTRFTGSLKGFSRSGAVRASIQPDMVDLFVEESPLRISFLKQAPKITAYTEKGKIYGGRHLHKQFSGKSTKVSGRMKGSVKKGEVSLKTLAGNIYLN